jgi:hypothetical protein
LTAQMAVGGKTEAAWESAYERECVCEREREGQRKGGRDAERERERDCVCVCVIKEGRHDKAHHHKQTPSFELAIQN